MSKRQLKCPTVSTKISLRDKEIAQGSKPRNIVVQHSLSVSRAATHKDKRASDRRGETKHKKNLKNY